jgi:hypothetical protein
MRRLRHEEHYSQMVFGARTACGTTECLAGHAVLISGYRLKFKENYEGEGTDDCIKVGAGRRPSDDRIERIADVAERLLGLTERQSDVLFGGSPADSWPGEFSRRWWQVRVGASDERRSRIAADFLDAIADGKVEL